MNELITVDSKNQLVSARELHEKLGATERFSYWFTRYAQYGFEENVDFTSVKSFTVVNNGAQKPIDDYNITIEMAKQLCMLQKSEKGKEFRQYFIDLEKAWNTPEQIFARALRLADETINNLSIEVKELKPKALFADAVSASDTSILVGEMAKILKQNGIDTGEKRLFVWLRENGYLIKRYGNDYNMPTQRSMELGLFEIKEHSHISNGMNKITKTPKITGKGQKYFVCKFIGEVEQKNNERK